VLEGTVLKYYENAEALYEDREPKGTLELTASSVVRRMGDEGGAGGQGGGRDTLFGRKEPVILVWTPTKELQFRGVKEDEDAEWIYFIQVGG
jgi:hypothetical protein